MLEPKIDNQFKVVVGGIIYQNKKILICQRKEEGDHPLKWEFPGGKVKDLEDNQEALSRELKEELNISTDLIYLDSFEYRVVLGNAAFEHEIDHVFIGFYDHPECQHNPDEIILTKWIEWSELIDDIKSRPKQFTPWLFGVLKIVHPHLIKLIS